MKWFSENNVRAFVAGHLGGDELLTRGVESSRVQVWDNPAVAAKELLAKLAPLPDAHPFRSDFGLVATQNRDLIMWALERLAGESK